jgi:hypothetical protein
MRDPNDVITHAVNGCTKQLAAEYEVSLSRMYEILSTDNPYPKAKRLIRKIGRVNPEGVRLIKADMEALFADILDDREACLADLHRESAEAVQSVLENRPEAVQRKEILDVAATAINCVAAIDRKTLAPKAAVKEFERQKRMGVAR